MSFKPLKTSVALASAATLAAFGLVAVPAQAAVGDVTLTPLTGTGTSVFITDAFTFQAKTNPLVSDGTTLAYRIDNPEQLQLHINPDNGTDDLGNFSAFGVKADGSIVHNTTAGQATDLTHDAVLGADGVVVDFAALEIVSYVIFELEDTASSKNNISIRLDDSNEDNSTENTAGSNVAHDAFAVSNSVTVTAWLESGQDAGSNNLDAAIDHLTVDSYSATQTLTFVPPTNVTPILRVERSTDISALASTGSDTATAISRLEFVNVVYSGSADVTSATGATNPMDVDDVVDGITLVAGDLVLVTGQTTATANGIYKVTAKTVASDGELTDLTDLTITVLEGTAGENQVYRGHRDGNGASLSSIVYDDTDADTTTAFQIVRINDPLTNSDTTDDVKMLDAGNALFANGHLVIVVDSSTEGDETGLYTIAADATGPGAPADLTNDFSGTVDSFNSAGDDVLTGSLRFSNADINLSQVVLSNWDLEVDSSVAGEDVAFASFTSNAATFTPAGNSSVDGLGRLVFTAPTNDRSLNSGATYTLKLRHGSVTANVYNSPGFHVVSTAVTTADYLRAVVTDTDNSNVDNTSNAASVALRNGNDSFTYVAQVYDTNGGSSAAAIAAHALETANIPMLAVVTAGANFAAGETLTVSGTNQKIETSNGTVVTSGTTNSDGQFSVTVTSSDSSSASAYYTVEFYVLDNNVWNATHYATGDNVYSADYAAPAIASTDGFTASTTVASGASVTLSFDLVDQFGQTLSANALGSTYSVELQAPDDDNLDLDAQVVGGTVSFTFDNYLGAGESDVLTARLYTGSSTSPSFVSGQTANVTLYNTNAVSGVNVPEELTAIDVEYVDFFDGKADSRTEPTSGRALAGTVVDANGAGIPGAPVTIAAEGFVFLDDTTYSQDSIDMIADSSGAFSVTLWSHVASGADGIDISVTSGAVTAESNVVVSVPSSALSTGNVLFSWAVPANYVMNTTYAVTATVTDIFGNPIANAAVTFTGLAAANFNGGTSAERVTGRDGTAIAYLRSLKDVDGISAISAALLDDATSTGTTYNFADTNFTGNYTDVTTTSWDESLFDSELAAEITFLKSSADVPASGQKVNAGSFKGYVALYAKGYEGSRMSAKVGNDWVVVPSVPAATNDLFRAVEFVGAGVDISVRIYIDRVLLATIPLLTK